MTQGVADAVLGQIARQQNDLFRRVREGALDPDVVNKNLQLIIEGKDFSNGAPALKEKKGKAKAPAKPPTDETPIWLASPAELEEWLRKRFNARTVKIISGMDNDAPTISSPGELDPKLVNVHRDGDPTYVLIEEKRRRAREEHGIRLGLREALLCHAKWQEIHAEWRPFWVYFAETVIEIDGDHCLVNLYPYAFGCHLYCRRLGRESNDDDQFARPRES